MSVSNPLTASSDISLSLVFNRSSPTKERALQPDLGVFSQDIVEISQLGLEKQQKETQVEASRKIEDIANEVISVSSTIGRARSIGSLTHSQATTLYRKISALM
jgi:hypothetical protein